ncbi:MAG TPA: hemolysin family protein [Thiobacillaceae bacterium]|nr:hemolysin family protein [Thiobacillaceae bacterium]
MDLALIAVLILINGLLSMAEMAVVSARRTRLHSLAEEGNPGAETALALHENPSSFLSTIQVGITSVGILSGAVGEAALTDNLEAWLSGFPPLASSSHLIALSIVVVGLTYFTVVVGELVPKRLALLAPETIASLAARPMLWLARLAKPLVLLLSVSSDMVLRALGAKRKDEPPVTDEEIKILMEQGAEAGVFHISEQLIVSNVLRLDEQRVGAIMTPRKDIYSIDLEDSEEDILKGIAESPYHRIMVCQDGMDNIVGVLQTGDLLKHSLSGASVTRRDVMEATAAPLYVPDTVTTTQLLENFRQSRTHFALIVDEYGDLQGLVTMTDVLTSIVGEISQADTDEEQEFVRREDGSWLIDGGVAVERLKAELDIDEELPGEEENSYNTLGGFVMHMLGRIPAVADWFECEGHRFEVVDMDRNRVDRVLVSPLPEPPDSPAGEEG